MAEPLTPEREAIVRQRQPGDWLPDAWLIRDVETVDGTVWQVLHRDTVLATLPDWAGNLALWIAEVHEDVPELLATIDRLRSDRGALRAEVLNEAADAVVAENDRMLWATKPGSHWAADLLRRLAAPPAPPVPDSTTGDEGSGTERDRRKKRYWDKVAADAEATHWRRLGIAPPVPDTTTGDEGELERLRARVAELEGDSARLSTLYAAGVDSWDGYDIALEGVES